MIPVDQTISSPVNGNCFEACVASVLERPLSDIPEFVAGNPEDWFDTFAAWSATQGFAAAFLPNTPPQLPQGYHIGICDAYAVDGVTVGHAVVACDGEAVHCPHPSRAGMGKAIRWWALLMPHGQPTTILAAEP